MDYKRIDCFGDEKQDFLVCLTVHKAKNLSILNGDTFVQVSLDKRTHQTCIIQKSDEPFFNEYFVFEMHCTIVELLRLNISMIVYQRVCCGRRQGIGELIIDLNTVWNQPSHAFYKRWGQLENVTDKTMSANIPKGYLQIDLSIVSKNEEPAPALLHNHDTDDIENNLLLPLSDNQQLQKVQYNFRIYYGEFLQKNNYSVQITFAGVTGKTKRSENTKTPLWNEQIAFMWYFPSLCQTFLIQTLVADHFSSSKIGSCQYHFADLTIDETGTTNCPTLGPTYLYFYNDTNPVEYVGRLLIALDTDAVPEHSNIRRKCKVSDVLALPENEYWATENFYIYLTIVEAYFLHVSAYKIKIQLICGAIHSKEIELSLVGCADPTIKYAQLPSLRPFTRVIVKLPDCRLKFQTEIAFDEIQHKLTNMLDNYNMIEIKNDSDHGILSKHLHDIIGYMEKKFDQIRGRLHYNVFKQLTQWDKNRSIVFANMLTEFRDTLQAIKSNLIKQSVNGSSTSFKNITNELRRIVHRIRDNLKNSLQDKWPDIYIRFMVGKHEIGLFKADAKPYFYSQHDLCKGRLCGQRHNIIIKPINCKHSCQNCGCICGVADITMWIGTEQEKFDWLPNGWKLDGDHVEPINEVNYRCNIYVHQAKIRPGNDKTGLCDARVRISFFKFEGATQVIFGSLSPIWNEIIELRGIKIGGLVREFKQHPPLIMLKLIAMQSKKENLLGIGHIRPIVKSLNSRGISFVNNIESFSIPSSESECLPNELNLIESISHTKGYEGKPLSPRQTNVSYTKPIQLKANPMPKLRGILNKRQRNKTNGLPSLQWTNISFDGFVVAEILISAELIEEEKHTEESIRNVEAIPREICPTMERFRIQAIFCGLRQAHTIPLTKTIGRYRMEIIFAELAVKSGPSGKLSGNSINFLDPFVTGLVTLPTQFKYWPPLIIKHLDCSQRQEKAIGAIMISNPDSLYIQRDSTAGFLQSSLHSRYIQSSDTKPETVIKLREIESEPLLSETHIEERNRKRAVSLKRSLTTYIARFLHKPSSPNQTQKVLTHKRSDEEELSWWTKFYNSLNATEAGEIADPTKHRLKIYDCELEKQLEFSYFQDWAKPYELFNGTSSRKKTKGSSYCTLKCAICVQRTDANVGNNYSLTTVNRSEMLRSLITDIPIVVRVYVVQGINLRSNDKIGYSDSYIKIVYGNQKISDRAHYIMNQANPIYGRRFQLSGSIPRDQFIHISIYDRDECTRDDLIGTTIIDVEDRLRSQHRATCGLPNEYSRFGYNAWRDVNVPSDILKELCYKHKLKQPHLVGNKIQIGGITFDDITVIEKGESIFERLSLSVLKEFHKVPHIDFSLVPEHVETRSLYRTDRPGIEQGKIQMWLELFNPDDVPPPIDLTPQPARFYQLRITVMNTKDIALDERNIFGTKMSDIYVKGWLNDIQVAQYTDIHYRSINGEGNFNWRMIFDIRYSVSEAMMIVTTPKKMFEKFDTEVKMPATLNLQIWDNDTLSADDFLGSTSITLSRFPKPVSNAQNCSLKQDCEYINLFSEKHVKGWIPVKGNSKEKDTFKLIGKIELELCLFLEDEVLENPAGLGRDPPNALLPPERPVTSFKWWTSPAKSFKQILLPHMRKGVCIVCVVAIVGLGIASILWHLPTVVAEVASESNHLNNQ